jgi:hypothetical protein
MARGLNPQQEKGVSGGRRPYFCTAAGLVVETAIIAWWLIGDLSQTNNPTDYWYHPPVLSPLIEGLIAGFAVVLGAALITFLVTRIVKGEWRRVRVTVLALLPGLVAAALIGYSERLVTSGVHGANMGGFFGLFVYFPFAFLMLAVSALLLGMLGRVKVH